MKLEGHDLKPGRDSGMIILETPKQDTEHFRMKRNDLVAFDYLWNARFRMTNYELPKNTLLGPPGRGLAQAFSSLAKGRGGIGVNSAAKIFKLLAHIILDPELQKNEDATVADTKPGEPNGGGWTSFRATFGKPIGSSKRIQTWVGRSVCRGLAGRVLGDLCFRLAANGVRDETQGMIAKVYATKGLLETAINCYQIQGGRSVHTDELRKYTRGITKGASNSADMPDNPIENYIGENMHEFTIATVYEGPNPVLADIGAPNAMTRGLRSKYLEPIGAAHAKKKMGLMPMAKFGLFVAKTVAGSAFPSMDLTGIQNPFPVKENYVRKALKRNRVLGLSLIHI